MHRLLYSAPFTSSVSFRAPPRVLHKGGNILDSIVIYLTQYPRLMAMTFGLDAVGPDARISALSDTDRSCLIDALLVAIVSSCSTSPCLKILSATTHLLVSLNSVEVQQTLSAPATAFWTCIHEHRAQFDIGRLNAPPAPVRTHLSNPHSSLGGRLDASIYDLVCGGALGGFIIPHPRHWFR